MRLSLVLASTCVVSAFALLAACGDSNETSPGAKPPPKSEVPPDAAAPQPPGPPGPPDGGAPSEPDAAPPGPRRRAHSGGLPAALAIANQRAFVTAGPRLSIWDVSDPQNPTMMGETEPFEGNLEGVAIVGSHAYVTQNGDLDGRLHVVDVSTPTAPKRGKTIRLAASGEPTVPSGIAADATRIYVADQEHGVNVLDVTDPSAPRAVTTLDVPGVTSVQVVGKRLYAIFKGFTGNLTMTAFDLSANLAPLGDTAFGGAASVAITTAHIAVATGTGGQQARDLSDLANPKDLTITGSEVDSLAVAAGASTVWIPGFDGLYVMDLSTPGTATIGPKIDVPTEGAKGMVVDGGLFGLVTSRGRFVTLDVSAPKSPVAKSAIDFSLCAGCGGIAIDGDAMVVADHDNGLRTGRVSDLTGLGRGYMSRGIDFEDVALAGGKAYVADWFFGMRIYDVATPSAPKALGTVDTAGYPSAVRFEDGRVYLGESTNGGALRVIDVADPAKPKEIGAVATSFVWTLEVRNKIVYVADRSFGSADGGLHIFDASDPASIKRIGAYDGCGSVSDVALEGNTAVVACDKGWDIVDITTLSAPKKLGHVDVKRPNSATAAALSGKRAYLGHSAGMIAVDITDPAQPKTLVEKPTAYEVRDLHAKDGHVVASCGTGGVYQWDVR